MCQFCETMQEKLDKEQAKFKTPGTATNLKDALSSFVDSIPEDIKTAAAKAADSVLQMVGKVHATFILTSRYGTLKSVTAVETSPDQEATYKTYLDGETKALAGDYVRVHLTLNDQVVFYHAYEVNEDRSKLVPVDAEKLPEYRNRTV